MKDLKEDRKDKISLDIIVPCYNEEHCISLFYEAIEHTFNLLENYNYFIIFIDDGSKDNTLDEIKKLVNNKNNIKYISFTRNFGKESAIYAGLQVSVSEIAVLMDCDLQHPPSLLPEMLLAIESGYDCCAGKRSNRKGEPVIRSFFSSLFYKFSNKISDVKIEPNATDFRMMNRKMVKAVLSLQEKERFTKGLISWVGFRVKWIEFDNQPRIAGKTNWSFLKLVWYAINGIVAFSTIPLRIASIIGSSIVIIAVIYSVFIFAKTLIFGTHISGFPTLVILILLLSGVIISLLGIIGEYLARIYQEIKGRPIYITRETNIEGEHL